MGNGIVVVSTERERDAVITLPNGTEIRETLPAMTTAVYDETTGLRLDTEEEGRRTAVLRRKDPEG